MSQGDFIVAHHSAREEMVLRSDHQPTRQNADASFKNARVDVELEAGYILACKQSLGEGDQCRVVGAQ